MFSLHLKITVADSAKKANDTSETGVTFQHLALSCHSPQKHKQNAHCCLRKEITNTFLFLNISSDRHKCSGKSIPVFCENLMGLLNFPRRVLDIL